MEANHPRVVIVVGKQAPLGGAEQQAVLLANGLAQAGLPSVQLLSLTPGQQRVARLRDSIPVRASDPGSDGSWFRRGGALARLVATLRRMRPEVLLPFTDLPNRVVGALWPLTGARACLWNQRDEGRQLTHRPMERLALRHASWFVANSEIGRRFLTGAFAVPRERITIIPNGVALPPPTDNRATWRRRLQLGNDTPLAVMVAHLHHFKDHETLVRAWPLVGATGGPPPVLVLAGESGSTAELVAELSSRLGVAQRVRMVGVVDDVSGLLHASDLALFSSRTEGCPNAVLEAMAAGLPVVATDIVGTREALGEDCELLTPERNPEAMAAAIERVLADGGLRRAIGDHNRLRVRERFSADAMVAAYRELFDSVLAKVSA